ncbi:MAG: hypothetical protein Q9228_003119 [Teloschistes exilis]
MSLSDTERYPLPKSYSALLNLSRDYTIECGSDPNDGFFPMPGLLKIHDYGILPVEEIRYWGKWRFIPHDEWRAETEERLEGNYWAETHTKPQMAILVPQNDRIPKIAVDRFCSLLMAHPKINTGTWNAKLASNNTRDDIAIQRERVAKSAEELATKAFRNTYETDLLELQTKPWQYEWRDHFGDVPQIDWDSFRALPQAQCFHIDIISKTYEDLDLLALLEEVAIEAGIPRLYASS